MPATDAATEKTGTRKSIDELTDVLGRSSEKIFNQANSALLELTKAGSDVFVGAVKIAANAAEAGADVLTRAMPKIGEGSTAKSRSARMANEYRDTVVEAVRVYSLALKQSVDVAQQSVDRIAQKSKCADTSAAAE